MTDVPDKPGIARWTPCSCATAVGMWDRASVRISRSIRDQVEPEVAEAVKRYQKAIHTRGKDALRYACASGDQDEVWYYGFATGAAIRSRGRAGKHFGEPGHFLGIDGLHRFPAELKLHRPLEGSTGW